MAYRAVPKIDRVIRRDQRLPLLRNRQRNKITRPPRQCRRQRRGHRTHQPFQLVGDRVTSPNRAAKDPVSAYRTSAWATFSAGQSSICALVP